MEINTKKTQLLQIHFGKTNIPWPEVEMNGVTIQPVQSTKLLGVIINTKLDWSDNTEYLCRKASKRVYFITQLKRCNCPVQDIIAVYKATIWSIVEYASPLWHNALTTLQSKQLENIQKRVLRIVFPEASYTEALNLAGLHTLESRRTSAATKFYHGTVAGNRISHLLYANRQPPLGMNLRNRRMFAFRCKTSRFRNSLLPYGAANY